MTPQTQVPQPSVFDALKLDSSFPNASSVPEKKRKKKENVHTYTQTHVSYRVSWAA